MAVWPPDSVGESGVEKADHGQFHHRRHRPCRRQGHADEVRSAEGAASHRGSADDRPRAGEPAPPNPASVVVVVAPGMELVSKAVAPHPSATFKRSSSAPARRRSRPKRRSVKRGVARRGPRAASCRRTLNSSMAIPPLSRSATFERLLARRRAADRPALWRWGCGPPRSRGRWLAYRRWRGPVEAIVEHRDATAAQRRIGLCNSGVMAVDGALLWELLAEVGNDNAKGEYYLTDIVALARRRGLLCAAVEAPPEELVGINSRAELATAEALLQGRLRDCAMAEARLIDPASVWFSFETRLGRDVTIGRTSSSGRGWRWRMASISGLSPISKAAHPAGGVIGPFARPRARQRHRGQARGSAISSRPRCHPCRRGKGQSPELSG